MRINIINGSPKLGDSTSKIMSNYITSAISQGNVVRHYNIKSINIEDNLLREIMSCEVLIFCFPLYVDSIPAHLLNLLVKLEILDFPQNNDMKVYCIVNNGFFEGIQNHIAIKQMKIWCKTVNITWAQAIGIGAGEMIPFICDVPLGHGPNKNLGNAIQNMSSNILNYKTGEDIYISPNWSRFIWRLQAIFMVWYPRAKKHNLKLKDLYKKMDFDS